MGFWATVPLCLPIVPVTVPSSSTLSCDHSVTLTQDHSQSLTVSSSHWSHSNACHSPSLVVTHGQSQSLSHSQSRSLLAIGGHSVIHCHSVTITQPPSAHRHSQPFTTSHCYRHSHHSVTWSHSQSLPITHSHFPSLTVAPHQTLASLGCCGSAALSGELGPFGTFLVTLIVAGAVEGLHRPQVRQRIQVAYGPGPGPQSHLLPGKLSQTISSAAPHSK